MKLIKEYGLLIFWGVLIADCLFSIFHLGDYRVYSKPLLLPILALYLFINTKRSKHRRSKTWIYSSLVIAWIADIVLLINDIKPKNNDILLFSGMALLLVSCVIYARMFRKMLKINLKDCQEAFLSSALMLILCAVFYKFLKIMQIGNFRYPVILGMLIMTLVLAYSVNVYKDKIRKNMAIKFFIPGIVTLIISFAVILAYRFMLEDADFLPGVIVLTYGFGQMLIVRGFTKYLKV